MKGILLVVAFAIIGLCHGYFSGQELCTQGNVNMRSQPSTTASIYFMSNDGEKVICKSSSTWSAGGYTWVRVAARGYTGYMATSFLGGCSAPPPPPPSGSCPSWKLYKQCDAAWKSNALGTSSETICSAGCAMSSVAMALSSYGINYNPGTLNTWLKNNGGYWDSNLIIWNTVANLGMSLKTQAYSITASQLKYYTDNCYPVVANVRNGGHWVLVTGVSSYPDVWKVNDPGYAQSTYKLSEMSIWMIYNRPGLQSSRSPSNQNTLPFILIPTGVVGAGAVGYLFYRRRKRQQQEAQQGPDVAYAEMGAPVEPKVPLTAHSYITPNAAPKMQTTPYDVANNQAASTDYMQACKPAAPFNSNAV